MRHRTTVVVVAGAAVLLCASWSLLARESDKSTAVQDDRTPHAANTTAPPPPPIAPPIALSSAIGQRIVTGYRGAKPTAEVITAVRAGRVGGVILFADNVPTAAAARRSVRRLQATAKAGGQPYLLVMIDQEGGDVRRLATAPPTMSPAQMGASGDVSGTARSQGRATGKALRRAGINIDLAPVADVPYGAGSFLRTRAFSTRPGLVARGACGFAAGLRRAGVAATFKHFPGLGLATGNTDLRPVVIDADRTAIDRDLAAYRACPKSLPIVMISSASYPKLGLDGPAVLASATYRRLSKTGFRGLTISDAFDTPAVTAQERPALRAIRAGVDLLLYGQDPAPPRLAYDRLLLDAQSGRLKAAHMRRSAQVILDFKDALRRTMR